MAESPAAPLDQATHWNQAGGQAWVELQGLMDTLNKPIEDLLIARGDPGVGGRVLDIGCGAGGTTLAMARRVGPQGLSLGVDVSAPLLELARRRAEAEGLEAADFLEGDAGSVDLGAGFDGAISRFGVMFFSDFDAAFANIRSSLRPGGSMVFACWRSPKDNPLANLPMEAVAHLLPPTPQADPLAPGRFAFADPLRVRGILERTGWHDIAIETLDAPTPIAVDDLVTLSLKMGPVANALRTQDQATADKVRETVHAALTPYAENGIVPMTAGCWLVTARA